MCAIGLQCRASYFQMQVNITCAHNQHTKVDSLIVFSVLCFVLTPYLSSSFKHMLVQCVCRCVSKSDTQLEISPALCISFPLFHTINSHRNTLNTWNTLIRSVFFFPRKKNIFLFLPSFFYIFYWPFKHIVCNSDELKP